MNVWRVLSVSWRRWYIFVPLLAATVAVAAILPKDSVPKYTVESIVMLQSPTATTYVAPGSTTTVVRPVNPLLTGSIGLVSDTALEATIINSRASGRELLATGFRGTYTVAPNDKQALLTIDTTDTSTAAAIAANKKLFQMITEDIDQRQGAAALNDPTQRVTVVPVTDPETTLVSKVSKYRGAAAIGLAGLILGLTITVLFDAALSSRGRRRLPRGHAASPAVGIQ